MKHHISRPRFIVSIAALALSASLSCPGALALSREDRLSPLAAGYLERARIMLSEKNFAGVIDQLKHLDTQGVALLPSEREDCAYLLALSLYQRGDADCVDALRNFAENYPASPQAIPAPCGRRLFLLRTSLRQCACSIPGY